MYSAWVLLVLIFVSSLPVLAVYIWFRAVKYKFSVIWFFSALLTGAAAFLPALIFQDLLSGVIIHNSRAALLFEFFIRIALAEEISRLLVLLVFFWVSGKILRKNISGTSDVLNRLPDFNSVKIGTAAGFIAGLGFSILENARYAASGMDIGIILLRVFTAAIHSACGSRIGAAAVLLRANPFQALLRIITATAIHGVYNFMVTLPGFPFIAAFIIAVSALVTAVITIKGVKFNSLT